MASGCRKWTHCRFRTFQSSRTRTRCIVIPNRRSIHSPCIVPRTVNRSREPFISNSPCPKLPCNLFKLRCELTLCTKHQRTVQFVILIIKKLKKFKDQFAMLIVMNIQKEYFVECMIPIPLMIFTVDNVIQASADRECFFEEENKQLLVNLG